MSVTSQARALENGPVKIKENSARAHILGFGLKFVVFIRDEPLRAGAYRSAASSAVPESPVASVAYFPKALFPKKTKSNAERNQQPGWQAQVLPVALGQALIAFHFIDLPAVCKSKKTHGTESVNARAYLGGMVRRNARQPCFSFSMQDFAGMLLPPPAQISSFTFVAPRGIFPPPPTHLTGRGARRDADARLT